MVDKINLYKYNSYQINPYVLKGIKSLDLTINDLLLIIYLTNIKNVLDIKDIEDKTSLTEEEILSSYSNLLTKGLIEVKMDKLDGKINESVSLDNLYNKLIYSEKETTTEPSTDIYGIFEREFGKTLTAMEYEIINKWIESGISEEVITNALREAVKSGVTNLRYVDKIIHESTKKEVNEKEELFDYDWINDNE